MIIIIFSAQTEIFHDAISEISEASHYSSSISEYAQDIIATTENQLDQLSSLHRQYDTEEAINPNKFSTARWRWVWVIDKVLISIRVNKCILAIWKRLFILSNFIISTISTIYLYYLVQTKEDLFIKQ